MILSLIISLVIKVIDTMSNGRGRKAAPVAASKVDPSYGYHISEAMMEKKWSGKYNDVY